MSNNIAVRRLGVAPCSKEDYLKMSNKNGVKTADNNQAVPKTNNTKTNIGNSQGGNV